MPEEHRDQVGSAISERISAHDRDGAVQVAIEAVASGTVTIPGLYDVLCDLLASVGDAWRAGDVEVWQEHFATAVVRTIIEACHPIVAERAASPNGHVLVLGTPPEEYHDLGLRMVSDRFELAGWTTHLLGANVPAIEMVRAARALEADAVVLSASTHFHRLALKTYVEQLTGALPGLRVWVGGAAFARDHDGWPAEMVLVPSAIPSLAERMA